MRGSDRCATAMSLILRARLMVLFFLVALMQLRSITAELDVTPAGTLSGILTTKPSKGLLQTQGTACTSPLTAVAGQPYCVVPSTVSVEAQQILKTKAPGLAPDPLTPEAAVQRRASFNAMAAPLSAAAAQKYLQSISNTTISGVPVTIGIPKSLKAKNGKSGKMMMHLHGGAYVYGSCQYYWHVSSLVAYTAGIPVTCVDYSLAPEQPYPAGLDDAFAVYTNLIKQYKPQNIVVMGDSAGGGLSLALTLKLKQEGQPLPGALVLMSPWSDLDKTGDTMTTLTGVDPQLQYELNLKTPALAYVGGDTSKFQDPFVSPLRANYSTPWPHTYIQVGLRDSFLSACVMLYRKLKPLKVAGVDIEISPWEGMWHIFSGVQILPEAVEANTEMGVFIQRHMQGH